MNLSNQKVLKGASGLRLGFKGSSAISVIWLLTLSPHLLSPCILSPHTLLVYFIFRQTFLVSWRSGSSSSRLNEPKKISTNSDGLFLSHVLSSKWITVTLKSVFGLARPGSCAHSCCWGKELSTGNGLHFLRKRSVSRRKEEKGLRAKGALQLAQSVPALKRTELLLFPDQSLHFPTTLTQALLLPVL